MRHAFKQEVRLLSGGLDVDVAVLEDSLEHAVGFGGDVLDACEVEFGGDALEEAVLFNIDDALIGDDPGVEVVIRELDEGKQPDGEEVDGEEDREDGAEKWLVKPEEKNV